MSSVEPTINLSLLEACNKAKGDKDYSVYFNGEKYEALKTDDPNVLKYKKVNLSDIAETFQKQLNEIEVDHPTSIAKLLKLTVNVYGLFYEPDADKKTSLVFSKALGKEVDEGAVGKLKSGIEELGKKIDKLFEEKVENSKDYKSFGEAINYYINLHDNMLTDRSIPTEIHLHVSGDVLKGMLEKSEVMFKKLLGLLNENCKDYLGKGEISAENVLKFHNEIKKCIKELSLDAKNIETGWFRDCVLKKAKEFFANAIKDLTMKVDGENYYNLSKLYDLMIIIRNDERGYRSEESKDLSKVFDVLQPAVYEIHKKFKEDFKKALQEAKSADDVDNMTKEWARTKIRGQYFHPSIEEKLKTATADQAIEIKERAKKDGLGVKFFPEILEYLQWSLNEVANERKRELGK